MAAARQLKENARFAAEEAEREQHERAQEQGRLQRAAADEDPAHAEANAKADEVMAMQEEEADSRRQRRAHELLVVEHAAEQVAAEMVELLDPNELHKVFETPHHALLLVADVSDVSSRFLRAAATFQLRAFLLACLDPGGTQRRDCVSKVPESLRG